MKSLVNWTGIVADIITTNSIIFYSLNKMVSHYFSQVLDRHSCRLTNPNCLFNFYFFRCAFSLYIHIFNYLYFWIRGWERDIHTNVFTSESTLQQWLIGTSHQHTDLRVTNTASGTLKYHVLLFSLDPFFFIYSLFFLCRSVFSFFSASLLWLTRYLVHYPSYCHPSNGNLFSLILFW